MSEDLAVRSVYSAFRDKLGLKWAAGRKDASRTIRAPRPEDVNLSLVGHLNFIHPHRVQVLGQTELTYLHDLGKNSRKDAVSQLFAGHCDLIVIADGQPVPDELREQAEAHATPLLRARAASQEVIINLQYYLNMQFAEKIVLHGVFMEVMGIGVLITGEASIGKSELALELVTRGHRLVADDAPEFSRIAPDVLSGTCPEVLRDFLEVRGLGVLNVRAMFGDSAIKQSKYLRLIIHLQSLDEHQVSSADRLRGSRGTRTLLGLEVPQITLPVGPGRSLAVLVEAAVRNHILNLKGYDAGRIFMERQQKRIDTPGT